MIYLSLPLGLVTAACWVLCVGSALMALGDLAPSVSVGTMMVQGHRFFDPDSFGEQGQVHQERFMKGFAGFFLAGFLTFAVVGFSMVSDS